MDVAGQIGTSPDDRSALHGDEHPLTERDGIDRTFRLSDLPEEIRARILAEVTTLPDGRQTLKAMLFARETRDSVEQIASALMKNLQKVMDIEDRQIARDFLIEFEARGDFGRHLVRRLPPIAERAEALKRWPDISDPIKAAREDLLQGIGTVAGLRTAHAIKDEAAYDAMVVETFDMIQTERQSQAFGGHWIATEEAELRSRFHCPSILKIEAENAVRMQPIQAILCQGGRQDAVEGINRFIAGGEQNMELLRTASPSVVARIGALTRSPDVDDRLEMAVRDVEDRIPASTSSALHGVKDMEAFDKRVSALADDRLEDRRQADLFDEREPWHQSEPYYGCMRDTMSDEEIMQIHDVPSVLARFGSRASDTREACDPSAARQVVEEPRAGVKTLRPRSARGI